MANLVTRFCCFTQHWPFILNVPGLFLQSPLRPPESREYELVTTAAPSDIPPSRQKVKFWICPFSVKGLNGVAPAEFGQPDAAGDMLLSMLKHPKLVSVTDLRLFLCIVTLLRVLMCVLLVQAVAFLATAYVLKYNFRRYSPYVKRI